jgi:aryl-alcohol dehydrogenase-like predicted oxidoreductase
MDATRRDLLRLAAGLGVGAVAGGCMEGSGLHRWWPVARDIFFARPPLAADTPRSEWGRSRVAAYRRLGRTGVHVSDISFGSAKVASPEVVREALDRGISYFDTSPDYADAASERAIGEGIRGRRDQVFLATKFCTPAGHLPVGAPVAEIVTAVEGSLSRLGTDHVDLVHIHACNEEERLFAPSFHEAFERLREQGKARFLGVSSHTPRMVQVMTAAIESGRFDVVMPAYSFRLWPELDRVLELARARDVGVVAMKTLKGAWHEVLPELREDAASYAQSAFRWVLANPRVSCLVISISERRQIDEYLVASGQAPGPEDVARLDRYDAATAGLHCRAGCGACLPACPEAVAIDDVLRAEMYATRYRDPEGGRRLYADLGAPASRCLGCAAPCTGACPFGLDIASRTRDAHALLRG